MKYQDQEFSDTVVELDNHEFVNCSFRDVVFLYSGGDLNMAHCTMDRFRFQFGGALATGLYGLYQLFGTDGMLQIIRGFTQPVEGEVELKPREDPAAAN